MDRPAREERLASWLDGELATEETHKLLAELREDEEFRSSAARNLVVQRLLSQQGLQPGDFTAQVLGVLSADELPTESVTGSVISELQVQQRRQRRILRRSFAVAVAAVLMLILSFVLHPIFESESIRVTATEGVGSLDIEQLERGEPVKLRRGILELVLQGDARVVIEAPADFSVVSPRHVRLTAGRCFVEMTKGSSGLRIETPSGDALDLGTQFAVEVPSPDKMEVHVFDGAVEVSDASGTTLLNEGQGLVLDETEVRKELVARPGQFVSRVPRPVESRDPLLYWSFDEAGGTQVSATGTAKDVAEGDGVLLSEAADGVVPKFVPGISGTALEFDGMGQWVNTAHPGIAGDEDRTVACWIRLPSDWGEGDKAPIMSWGLKRRDIVGQAWMLSIGRYYRRKPSMAGRLRLSVGGQFILGSTDLRDGRWHHIAVVSMHDFGEPSVLLYVDGSLEHVTRNTIESVETETAGKDAKAIRFGRQIFFDHVFMRGALDEVYILEGALSGDQVRDLMLNVNHTEDQ